MAENKKDSFTFSDKIKNSKPAFNPFSKRVSSKIGNNGKPKKTLFERTRRDAPFFVAAAAALLMLPFLYKYSGSVEDGAIITPGTDSVFEPDHTRIDPIFGDPSTQISQYSARDPLSLIKGWGDPEPAPTANAYDRDGMDDTYTPPARSYRNESSYRQQAPAQTRASFNRQAPAPTKVNKLGSAGMNLRGGGGGFGRFGGANLKTAAKASSAEAPKAGVKPVSLQPLRAAGNPSRSYFGQGSAAQARASRDAMGKANALQALSDAMYDPLKANRSPLGGLGGGDFVGGAGAGKWDPHSEYKGITPWWWDMMKQQEMEKWKWKYFLWRKGLVEPLIKGLADFILKWAEPRLSCIAGGTDDWSVGAMGPKGATAAVAAGCEMSGKGDPVTLDQFCDPTGPYKNEEGWARICNNSDPLGAYEKHCKGDDDDKIDPLGKWNGGSPATPAMTRWDRVRFCLNENYSPKSEGSYGVNEAHNCEDMNVHSFRFSPDAGGYYAKSKFDNFYHIVIAKNVKINGKSLCEADKIAAGWSLASLQSGNSNEDSKDGGKGSASVSASGSNVWHGAQDNASLDTFRVKGGPTGLYNTRSSELKYAEDCVIYVAQGKVFNYENYQLLLGEAQKSVTVDETDKNLRKGKGSKEGHVYSTTTLQNVIGIDWDNVNIDQFQGKIIPVAIEGYIMKEDPFYEMRAMHKAFPMMYKDFMARFMNGKDFGFVQCDWSEFDINAHAIIDIEYVAASLTYGEHINPDDIKVTLDILGSNGEPVVENVAVSPVQNKNQVIQGVQGYVAKFTADQLDTMKKYVVIDPESTFYKELTADWKATKDDKFASAQATYRGEVVVGTEVEVPAENPQGRNTVTSANVALLSRDMADIPAVGNERNPSNTSGSATKYSSGTAYAFEIRAEDKNRLDSAFVGSQAAVDYVNGIITKYNAKVGDSAVQLARSGEKVYPTLPEFVDAMNIAKTYLREEKVGKGIVCDMARGIASVSQDDTSNNNDKRDRSTGAQASGSVQQNTFGAFAIYMGDGHLFPTQLIRVNGEEVPDFRFDCIKNGYYICTPDYSWQNYVNSSSLEASAAAKADIAKATKNGTYSRDPKDYPLGALHQGNVTGSNSVGLRKSYAANFAKVFGEGDTCELEGDMEIADALRYVELVTKNGLDFKPKASNKVKGQPVGGNNPTGSNGTAVTESSTYLN